MMRDAALCYSYAVVDAAACLACLLLLLLLLRALLLLQRKESAPDQFLRLSLLPRKFLEIFPSSQIICASSARN